MADQNQLEVFKKAFSQENTPQTDLEIAASRQAAGFALAVFDNSFADPHRQAELGIELSDEQIQMAKRLAEVWPTVNDTLPGSSLNAAGAGYHVIQSDIFQMVPLLLGNPDFPGEDIDTSVKEFYQEQRSLFDQDHSGVALLNKKLTEMEDDATQSQMTSSEKYSQAQKLVKKLRQDLENIPRNAPDQNTIDEIDRVFEEIFGAPPNPREKAIHETELEIFNKTGLVHDKKGNLTPYAVLKVLGARYGFEKFERAVDYYLNRWGPQSNQDTKQD